MDSESQLTSSPKLILCVEDEKRILENNRKVFSDSGFNVLTAENLKEARAHLADYEPDAIVLDIMLPDGLGLDLLRELREGGSKIPVIMLTAWGEPDDIARGLDAGANDYLSKPFEYSVLLSRVKAMFRNVEQLPEILNLGGLQLKLMSREALIAGEPLGLSPKEYDLLQFFVQNRDRSMSAAYVYEAVWGQPMTGDAQALRSAVSRLRKKLQGSGYTITSEYGGGYRFERG
ncbi:MAG: response regulator transcription factor [Clostridiales bacterium]|jgi:DNA-binding response OmpR family regulator|nr:response regulator transcription factor [Clostridiales bacterium]